MEEALAQSVEMQPVELRADEMLIGTVRYSVDDKGRVVVPAELRQRLGSEFYLTISAYDTIFIFAPDDWRRYSEKLMQLYNNDPQRLSALIHRVLSFASKVKTDGNWRFLLPQQLRERCKLQKTVYFVGIGDRLELMNEESYRQRFSRITDEAVKQLQAELGL